jgi:hypothetical protein
MQGSSTTTINGSSSGQSLQSNAGSTNGDTATTSQFQPQDNSDLLSSSGVVLTNNDLPAVNLNATGSGTISSSSVVKVNHHISYGLLAITALLVIAAIGISWATIRGDYSTTE